MILFFHINVILLFFSFLVGCSSFSYQSPHYTKLAHEITEKTAKELKVQKNLCLVGTGGQMMNDIQMMAMSFYYYQEVDLKTARELIVYSINKYLSAINGTKEIKPYLHEYPFTAKNVEIRIWFFQPNRSNLPLDKIHYVSAINGNLTYYLDLDEACSRGAICEESYEEALQEIDLNPSISDEKESNLLSISKQSEKNFRTDWIGSSREIGLTPMIDKNSEKKKAFREAIAKDGAKVSVTVDSFEYSMFQISGEGFKAYESLSFISNSCNEVLYFTIQTDKNGNIPMMGFLPEVIGESGGICHIDILRDQDVIHIKLPWGTKFENTDIME